MFRERDRFWPVSKPAQTVREIRTLCAMINPSGDEFGEDIPLSASADVGEEKFREGSARVSEMAGDAWGQAKEKAGAARVRTEIFLRENPIPTLLGALGIGIAIGLAIRYALTSSDTKEKVKESSTDAVWSFLSLPFLWPLFKSVKEKAEDSAEAVKEGVDRLKKVKVSRYAKPIRRRWKSWTR
jgi:hypothetical protein